MSDEISNVRDAMFKYWANHPCGIGIAEANAEWHINQTATLRTQLAEAQARIEVKDAAISRVLKYLRSPEDEAAEFVERVLDSALSPTAGQSLLEEVKGFREALEEVRSMAVGRKAAIRMRNGLMLDSFCSQALEKGGK